MTSLIDQFLCNNQHLMPMPTFLRAAEYSMVYNGISNVMVRKYWMLELIVSGAFAINVEKTAWKTCTEHTGILYPPQTYFRERSENNVPPGTVTKSLYLEFDLLNSELLYELFEKKQNYLWLLDMDESLEKLLQLIVYRASSNTPSASIYTIGIFYQILSLLLSSENKNNTLVIHHDSYPISDIIMKVHLFMRNHLSASIQLKDIAEYVSMSESGLSHAYKKITGQSPLTTLRSLRIEAARNKLLRGNLTLETIAEQTGFSDAFHLSRSFKKATGLSPRQYLNSMRS